MQEYNKHDRQLNFWISFPMIFLMMIIASIPVTWPILSIYDGKLFPVFENVRVNPIGVTDRSLIVSVKFDKIRACEYDGLSWFDGQGNRILISYEPNEEGPDQPITRPVKEDQDAGPWELFGITDPNDLAHTYAVAGHWCSPFWKTYTKFYP